MKIYVIEIKTVNRFSEGREREKCGISKMKVYPVMFLKTNGQNMSEGRYPVMLLKIIDL